MDFFNDFNLFNYRKEKEKYLQFVKIFTPQVLYNLSVMFYKIFSNGVIDPGMYHFIISCLVTYLGIVGGAVWYHWKESEESIQMAEFSGEGYDCMEGLQRPGYGPAIGILDDTFPLREEDNDYSRQTIAGIV